ncbi:MAG: hypothetical protein WC657_01940 [Candidatus Paceibacterota bacterium]|jgi:hypothetical protein
MENKTLGLAALTLILGATALSAGSALAYRGDPTIQGPNYSTERHTAMLKAFENKDYTVWKSLMQNRGRVTDVITEANFAKFVEAHNLAVQGKTAEAQKIRQELGLGLQNGSGRNGGGMMSGMGMGRNFNR